MSKDRDRRPDPLTRALLTRRVRFALSAGTATLLAAFLAGDWLARTVGGRSLLAPTAGELWLAAGLGGLYGMVGRAKERFALSRWRAAVTAPGPAPALTFRWPGWMALWIALVPFLLLTGVVGRAWSLCSR